jgi:hypothetical protein
MATVFECQGGIPLKLTSAVITLCVLGCSAAFAQGSFTLGFASPADEGLSCNYEQIQYGGSNNFYMQGIDNITDACFAEFGNATIEGVKVSIVPSDGSLVLAGPAYAYADTIYDAFSGDYTGYQWFVITQTKPSTLLRHYGWVGYLGFSGFELLADYGYLSASYPGANKSGKPILGTTNASAALSQKASLSKTIK